MSFQIEMRNDDRTRMSIRSFMRAHDEKATLNQEKNTLVLVYKKSSRVIAGAEARMVCGNCFVPILFVIPEERKRGLGSSLLNELRSFQMKSKASRMTISTREIETKQFLDERGLIVDGRIRHCPTSHTLAFYSGTPRFKKVDVSPADTLKKNAQVTHDELLELKKRIEMNSGTDGNHVSVTLALIDGEGNTEGGLIGSFHDDCLEIEHLIVSPSLRGRGYGKRLLETIEAYGKDKNLRRVLVRPFCFHDQGFFSHMGYRGFETPCQHVMSKSL